MKSVERRRRGRAQQRHDGWQAMVRESGTDTTVRLLELMVAERRVLAGEFKFGGKWEIISQHAEWTERDREIEPERNECESDARSGHEKEKRARAARGVI